MTAAASRWQVLRSRRALVCLALAAAAALLWWLGAREAGPQLPAGHLTLVLPDGWRADDTRVRAWQDAAVETGFALQVVGASQLLRAESLRDDKALIVPDSLHQRMNDALLANLERRVREGARLMLVHDAGVADLNGEYHPQQSRLSALAGVRYALYGALGTGMLREQVAWVDADAVPLLRLPPGKLLRQGGEDPLTSAQPAPLPGEQLAVAGYHYGRLRYAVFMTDGRFAGRSLMHGEGGNLLAGVNRVGLGEVLFVNLPLTYLKLRTDGLFLHTFLRYFAQDLAGLPQFSPMPDARGALVMNWHVDSAAALPAMEKLTALGAFEQGPYSVHLTAGPDVDVDGDGGGLDLQHSETMRRWIGRLAERGDEIGSHGGWIHNAFGRLVSSQDRGWSTELIERNSDVIRGISGKPVREYSAPSGNHPAWITPLLHARGVRAYYFTGDIGMAPTRSYQDGKRSPDDMWAFPVLSYGSDAAFEEARANQVAEGDLGAWLNDVADYCAANRTLRLVYFHPPGIAIFPNAFKQWLEHTRDLAADGLLHWMTMAQYAEFANRRLQASWQVERSGGRLQLQASHPDSLQQMSWLLPQQRFGRPQLLEGQAQIAGDGAFWRITAGAGKQLVVGLSALPPAAHAPATAPASATAPLSTARKP